MRVFCAIPSSANYPSLPHSEVWKNNIVRTLEQMGHEVVSFHFDWCAAFSHLNPEVPSHAEHIRRLRPIFCQELLRQITHAHAQKPLRLFLGYLYTANVTPETILAIRHLGIITLNWYCNASYQFHLVQEIAPAFDYCLVPEKFRIPEYINAGARPIYCQEAANPEIYRPHDVPKEYDVTFVGQQYGNRAYFVRQLYDAGINVRVWGPNWCPQPLVGWRRIFRRAAAYVHRDSLLNLPPAICGPSLSDEEMILMYSRSRISLGFSTVAAAAPGEKKIVKQVRLRDFEAVMSGAFYLTEACPELADFFIPGKEIVFFEDAADLIEKCRHYLAHPEEREQIRQAGLRRARAEHTWRHRFEAVFRQIGLYSS